MSEHCKHYLRESKQCLKDIYYIILIIGDLHDRDRRIEVSLLPYPISDEELIKRQKRERHAKDKETRTIKWEPWLDMTMMFWGIWDFFFLGMFKLHSMVHDNYSWLCARKQPLTIFKGPYAMLEIKQSQ